MTKPLVTKPLVTTPQMTVVCVAPTGARRGKADHPALPISPDEIAREAARCREAGAAMIHLHVRDAEGRHSIDPELNRAALAAVARESDILVQVTTEAVGRFTPAEQVAAMRALAPEAFSIAVRELFPDAGAEGEGAAFLADEARRGALVQHILYDAADAARFADLVRRGAIPEAGASALFVLGRHATDQQSRPDEILPFLAEWNLALPWSLCAFGRREAGCLVAAALLGGHARVGFENNLHRPDGSLAADNAAQVADLVAALAALGLAAASPAEARAIFSGD